MMSHIAFLGLGAMGAGMAANLAKVRPAGASPSTSRPRRWPRRRRAGCEPAASAAEAVRGRGDGDHHAAGRRAGAAGLRRDQSSRTRRTGRAGDRLLDHRRGDRPGRRRQARPPPGFASADAPVSGGIDGGGGRDADLHGRLRRGALRDRAPAAGADGPGGDPRRRRRAPGRRPRSATTWCSASRCWASARPSPWPRSWAWRPSGSSRSPRSRPASAGR